MSLFEYYPVVPLLLVKMVCTSVLNVSVSLTQGMFGV